MIWENFTIFITATSVSLRTLKHAVWRLTLSTRESPTSCRALKDLQTQPSWRKNIIAIPWICQELCYHRHINSFQRFSSELTFQKFVLKHDMSESEDDATLARNHNAVSNRIGTQCNIVQQKYSVGKHCHFSLHFTPRGTRKRCPKDLMRPKALFNKLLPRFQKNRSKSSSEFGAGWQKMSKAVQLKTGAIRSHVEKNSRQESPR